MDWNIFFFAEGRRYIVLVIVSCCYVLSMLYNYI